MNIIAFIIVLFILGSYCIYRLSDGYILKSIFYPTQSGEEAAEEYLKRRKK